MYHVAALFIATYCTCCLKALPVRKTFDPPPPYPQCHPTFLST